MPNPTMFMCFTTPGSAARTAPTVVRQPPRQVNTGPAATMNIAGLKNAKPCGSCGGRR